MVVGGDLYQILNRFSFFDYSYHQLNGYSLGFKHSYPVYQVASTWPHQRDKSDLSSIFPLRMNHLPKHPIRDPLPHELVAESLAGPQVLLVDDDPESLSSASDYLASSGLKVDSFTDPFTAAKRFAVADRAFYSLVIIDISMPLLNGLQLFQWLKTVVPEIKALFLSDYEVPSEFISVLPGIATEDIMVKPLARDPFVATTISKIKGNKSS